MQTTNPAHCLGVQHPARIIARIAPRIAAAARPRRMSNVLVSKTRDGGHYGPHVDNAMMRKGTASLRSDVSFTLFLSAPDTYEGGELTIHSAGSTQSVKGKRGQATWTDRLVMQAFAKDMWRGRTW